MIELRCDRDLVLKLGAVILGTLKHDRELRDAGQHMLIRDQSTFVLFWRWQVTRSEMAAARSS
jgi:hypothetical protein